MDGDKNWDWEGILHLEHSAYIEGVIAGENYQNSDTDSSDSEGEGENEYDSGEGYSFGFLKGLSIGLELGFMSTAVQLGETDALDTTTTTTTQRDFQRISKRRADLLKRIASMPRTNNSFDGNNSNFNQISGSGSSSSSISVGGGGGKGVDIDFESEIRSIRALFMQCSSPVGSLVNSAVKADQQKDW